MKKRLLALSLVLALTLALGIPALMAGGATSDAAATLPNNTWIDVASVSSYAVVKTDGYGDASKLSWKATVATKDNRMDFAKIAAVKDASYLIIAPGAVNDVKTAAPKVASLSSLTGVEFFKLLPAGTKPTGDGFKPTYYDEEGVVAMAKIAGLTADFEWIYANAAGTWEPGVAGGKTFDVKPFKQEIWVRAKATTTAGPSASVKISLAALAADPVVKLDLVKGQIKAKAGWLVGTVDGVMTATLTSQSKGTITLSASATSLNVDAPVYNISESGYQLYFRVPASADGKKPGSGITVLSLEIPNADEKIFDIGAVSPNELFNLTTKDVQVIGGVPVQILTGSGTSAKWKTVKALKLGDGKDINFGGSVKIRIAGTKSVLPGTEYTLKLLGEGALTIE